MIHIDVTRSSMISALDYDEAVQELTVTFNNGGKYKYFDVPKEAFDALLADEESIGKHFGSRIKNKYRYEKV